MECRLQEEPESFPGQLYPNEAGFRRGRTSVREVVPKLESKEEHASGDQLIRIEEEDHGYDSTSHEVCLAEGQPEHDASQDPRIDDDAFLSPYYPTVAATSDDDAAA